ncbi:gamma-glutamylcyclotransferase family protein [Aminipila terrae]|uniref:Gamma-glutamylcyclotransferase n=1 Tax=Aminipila terrae TaxID=2697030 RepID=A0A6P1MG87_9FIRM|nr:gamma-glutamylcyclotransferase family protein [Aminipila terrae]QHI72751.1 gamma-glutamylcyclotransferase [Aminipila terrae]
MECKNKIYAAYGNNMTSQQMTRICPFARLLGIGVLENYKLTFRGKRKGVANIERCEGASIPVVLWNISGICTKILGCCGRFSGPYIRDKVEVKFNNEIIEAIVFVMPDAYQSLPAKPTPFYIETLEKGYDSNGLIKDVLFNAIQESYRERIIGRYERFM